MSLTKVVQEIRTRQKVKFNPPDMPTAVWTGKDLLDGKPVSALTIIFQTRGCRWNNCTMCGYVYDGAQKPPSHGDQMSQYEYALSRCKDEEFIVKIFTSGSFLDDCEIAPETRNEMLSRLAEDNRVKKVIAETRPEYVTKEKLSESTHAFGKRFEVAIGLETSNDMIRKECINKGFTFSDFVRASEAAKKEGATVKAYLMLKPPFLSEGIAMNDMIQSINEAAPYAGTISVNLCNVQRGTLVDEMFERGDYRPPWLWSAVEVLKMGKESAPGTVIMSDPVGAGSPRGPHNCGKCDKDEAEAIRIFSLTQDTRVFNNLDCECKELWKKVVELEDFTFGAPIVK
ncbi:MAG: archaeosine biosynthesis radical SAM protein RaSEA [Euryarchaeota archaeon]|nr:archaeosine biosynthesis radical SAM protein RaSEA [Euryarchaeota archaeon]MBU4491658.1 archaeosine biosynthesis radical SAM protein RaSEA [Euryarchaeota archaeon]MCG2727461.1 archaeosine biosynthesis radical SAM protein RaSEA [Candidatus Methanoperedenaceae archaeon]